MPEDESTTRGKTTRLPVLMYHSVPTIGPGDRLAVPLQTVDRQWRALRADGWTLRGLTAALELVATDQDARVIGVTFDDGLADFANVADLLGRHDATVTLYVSTSLPGESTQAAARDPRWLTWDEIASLPEDLVEVGSHAHHHQPLDILAVPDVEDELRRSRHLIAARAGRDAVSFCYPYGYSSEDVRRRVAAAGYANACVVGRRIADPFGDPYAIPRLHVTALHDERGVVALANAGESGLAPQLKSRAYPAWRLVRRGVYQTTGRILT